ncbi:MAG: F0F1 ATP synthase subunit B [Chitinispirillaceae bacterium]|nr:F0F1 ATP synthase subunit B [Chitinispirillaceae bacterium]
MPEINWQNMLSQVITFLIALAIVWKFGWKQMVKFINDRQEKIRKTLENAETTRQAITMLEAEYRAKLEQVEQKSAELISIARQEGLKMREEIVRAAHEEAAGLQKKAREQLDADRNRIMNEMRAEIVGLAMSVAEKVLREPMADKVHERKFQEILEELSKGPSRRPS